MARLKWLVLLLGLGILLLGGAMVIQAQSPACNKNPAIGPVLNTTALPYIENFDPCTKRLTMRDNALKHSGGPYVSKAEVESWATRDTTPTKVRSYFLTYGQFTDMMQKGRESADVYPDREVWLVVVQAPNQGPMPIGLPYGVKPWPRRWYWAVYDATTGNLLEIATSGSKDGDWPASLPKD